jgi:Contractile injection system tape measure protein
MGHVIKKQVLKLKLATDIDMFSIQQKARDYYYQHILPAIEKVLDGLTDEDHVIQIDKLEVDLGEMKWEESRQEMSAQDLYQKIEKEAKKIVQQIHGQQYLNSRDGKASVVLEKPIAQYACEQWLHYMRNGYLHWNVQAVSSEWRLRVLEALATDYALITEIKELIGANTSVRQRLINDHPVSFLVKLMEVLTATDQKLLPQLVQEIDTVLSKGEKKLIQPDERPIGRITGWIWQQYLTGAVEGKTSADIAKRILQQPVYHQQWEDVILFKDDLSLVWPVLESVQKDFSPEITGSLSQGVKKEETVIDWLHAERKKDTLKELGENELNKDGTIGEEELPADGIFAPHAGLVLLHPFLRHLFLHTGLTENGKFNGTEAQEKAVWLLHYIATGHTDAEEYQLVVPKILCGYPLEGSPDNTILLEETVKEEAIDMMKAAIAQWTIIKNTSVEALREGFLQRKGKIYRKNGDICFVLETSAIDLLLDHLPWNLSIVKLPWSKELIKVEWR